MKVKILKKKHILQTEIGGSVDRYGRHGLMAQRHENTTKK